MSRPIHAMSSSSWISSSFRASALLLAAPLFSAVVEAQTTSSCTNVTTARTTVCTLGDNQELTVDRTGSITTATGRGIGAGSNNSIINRGNITATNSTNVADGAISISGTGNTLTNTGNITTTTGRGIGGETTSSFNTLTNRVSTGTTGRITGSTDGIRVGFIADLTNDVRALIRGTSGAGVALTRGIGTAAANVTNSGTIRGGNHGLHYENITIGQLTNNRSGLIQDDSAAATVKAAVRAQAITRLVNDGRIISTNGNGIFTANGISRLNNSGTISGGLHGVDARTVNLNNSGDIIGGTSGLATDTDRHALNLGDGNSAIVNTGKITSARGRGISSATLSPGVTASPVLTALINSQDLLNPGSGVIEGSTDGVSVGFIERLVNNARAVIEGKAGAGIVLTRTTAGTATVTNSGTIKGATFGLDYDGHTISTLTNSGTIQGGAQAGVRATTITRLENKATGRIVSTGRGAVQSTGVIGTLAIGTLENAGEITGGEHGVSAGSLGTLINSGTIEGKGGAGINITTNTSGNASVTNSGTIKGTSHGMDYIGKTLTSLTNSGTIEGRDNAGVRAAAITKLDNKTDGKIVSTNSDGVEITGAINTLENAGTISGGRHGVNALTVALSNSGDITGGTSGTTTTDRHALNLGTGNSTIVNTGTITSARGRGISGTAATVLTRLTNSEDSTKLSTSGKIEGSTDGISVGFIQRLVNNAGAVIEGKAGAGVVLTRTTAGTAEVVTNSGTIKGTTFGLNYGAHTISTLTNSGTIQGGTEAGVQARTITALDNKTGGKITSTSSDGVRTTGSSIGTLTNAGEISGGRDGVRTSSLATLTNSGTIEGKGGAGIHITTTTAGNASVTNSGTIKGTTYGMDYTTGKTLTLLTNSGTIQGVANAGVRAAAITELDNETGGKITSTSSDGVQSAGAIDTLKNAGTISGGRHGVSASSLATLTNSGTIEGKGGAGIHITTTTAGNASVTNSGTIKGTTYGMDYTTGKTLTLLTNSGTIQGGTEAGVLAAAITELDNKTGGKIISTSSDGVQSVGAIDTLKNAGTISGGQHGVRASSLATLTNSDTIEGKGGAGITLSGTTASRIEIINSGTIQGTTFGLDYGTNTIARLENRDRGRIEGGTGAAVTAGNITELKNEANAKIESTDGAGISSSGMIGTLTNSGHITSTNNAGIALSGTGGSGTVINSGVIQGGTYGLDYGANTITRLENRDRGEITGGSQAAVRAGDITELTNETNARIVSRDGAGISSSGMLGTLSNSGRITSTNNAGIVLSGTGGSGTVINSGVIQGGTDGLNYGANTITRLENWVRGEITGGTGAAIAAGNIDELTNEAKARIVSRDGAGVSLSGTGGSGTVINSGVIKGGTDGLNYGANTITNLENRDRGRIEGGTGAAIAAGNIDELTNEANARIVSTGGAGISSSGAIGRLTNRGRITSTNGDGISSTGAITRLTNSNEISGGRHGISALSVGLTNSGDITGGTSGTGAAVNLTGAGNSTVVNTGNITSARGRGISGVATSSITELTNSTRITGSTDGIRVGFISRLINNAGAIIRGTNGAGITLIGTASTAASVTNRGAIQGATDGMNYGSNAISTLTNSGTGRIEAGSGAAVAAGNITELENDTQATIVSTDGDGIRSSGSISTLTNRGTISGGRHGISAVAVGLTNTGVIRGGTSSAIPGRTANAGVYLTGAGSMMINRGQISAANGGNGIGGSAFSSITSLLNEVSSDMADSGAITGDNDGIQVGFISRLINNAGAIIRGTNGAGITLIGTANTAATVTNRGAIQGATDGMNYGSNAISTLTNTGMGRIEAGSGAAVAAGNITELENDTQARIVSTNGDGIRSSGSIGTLINRGTISGGRYGISAVSVGLTNSGNITGGTSDVGTDDKAAVNLTGPGNSTIVNTGNITSARGRGISGAATSSIAALTNNARITGNTDGIEVGFIGRLINNAGAIIRGTNGAGINLTGTASTAATVTNRGTIQGATHGMNYGGNTIRTLINSGAIRGGTQAAVAANAITRLENAAEGTIISTQSDGIDSRGAIGTLINRGAISGGRHGITALSVGLTNSGVITGGTSDVGTGDKAAVNLTGAGNSTVANTGKITSARGRGISGQATSVITALTSTVDPAMAGSGAILGSSDGIQTGFIGRLINNAGAIIRGSNGAGINLTGTASTAATVTNRGAIQGATHGMNYGRNTIGNLTNTGTGRIEGGTGAAVAAAAITELENAAGGTIKSSRSDGIDSRGAIGTLINRGAISGGRHGVNAASVGLLTNDKTITGGANGSGLNVSGEVATLNNSRDAEISGGRDGVRAGSLIALTNNGRIVSANGGGITLTGRASRAATVMNTGTIQGATHGMDYGRNTIASLTNTSADSIRGGSGDALRAQALLNLNNSGTIASTAAGGITLTGTASGATFTNSGLIEGKTHGLDYGNNAIALLDNTVTGILRSADGPALVGGALERLNNRGTIAGKIGAQIQRAMATASAPGGATIDNYGLLAGSGGTALALQGPGLDSLLLREGARLQGLVRWDGAGDTFFYAPRDPGLFSFRDNDAPANSEPTSFNIDAPAQQTILRTTRPSPQFGEAHTTVAFIDSSLYAVANNTLSRWTGSVSEMLAQQTRSEGPAGAAKQFWLRPFAGYQSFKRDGLRPSIRHDYVGALAGFSRPWKGIGRVGFFGGAATAEVDVNGAARDQDSDSFFAGAYVHGPVRGLHVHGALLVGQSRFESTWEHANNLASGGREQVQVDYNSLFVSPQIGLGGEFDLFGVQLRPAVQLRYLGRFTDDHAYQPVSGGAPALFSIKKHAVHMGLLRTELRAPKNLWKDERGRLDGEMRLGVEGSMVFSGREIPASLAGGDVAFQVAGRQSVRRFIGANLQYKVPKMNLMLSADIEGGYTSNSATSVWGQLGFEWEF